MIAFGFASVEWSCSAVDDVLLAVKIAQWSYRLGVDHREGGGLAALVRATCKTLELQTHIITVKLQYIELCVRLCLNVCVWAFISWILSQGRESQFVTDSLAGRMVQLWPVLPACQLHRYMKGNWCQ